MATKGATTRRRLIETAAPLFNRRGYAGASLSEVMAATGLEKGGIYNHFANKDELAVAAFDHNVAVIRERLRAAIADHRDATARLHAILDVYRDFAAHPPVPGGCPLLNTAVDADDTHPALRRRVRDVFEELRGTVRRIVERGIERNELRTGTDPDAVSTVFVAAVEGALMLAALQRSSVAMDYTADHLSEYVTSLAPRRGRRLR